MRRQRNRSSAEKWAGRETKGGREGGGRKYTGIQAIRRGWMRDEEDVALVERWVVAKNAS